MRERMYLLGVAAAAVIVLAGCTKGAGLPKNPLPTPEATVQAYCDLDAQGTRLTSSTWNKVLPYIAWSEEAGFDRAIVISGFTVGMVQKKGGSGATIPVTYEVLGVVAGTYTPGKRTETVRFQVEQTDRGWKIIEPDFLPPHVLAEAMARHLEGTRDREAAAQVRKVR